MAWIDLTEDMEFTDQAYKDFHPGMLMRFNFEGSMVEMKIMRIDRKTKKIWVTEVRTLSLDEFEKEMDKRREEAFSVDKK